MGLIKLNKKKKISEDAVIKPAEEVKFAEVPASKMMCVYAGPDMMKKPETEIFEAIYAAPAYPRNYQKKNCCEMCGHIFKPKDNFCTECGAPRK